LSSLRRAVERLGSLARVEHPLASVADAVVDRVRHETDLEEADERA
jgi:hypothetical protein